MAEPLKNSFGTGVIARIADSITTAYSEFDVNSFIVFCTAGYNDLELTDRARHIAAGMAKFLPGDRSLAL